MNLKTKATQAVICSVTAILAIVFNIDDGLQVSENGLRQIKEGFTLEQPKTQYDEWINQAWVTNKENQYIGDFNQVDDDRRQLYIRVCDPLIAEANIKRLQGFESEVSDIETQVLAARVEIQNSNPWPAPLTS